MLFIQLTSRNGQVIEVDGLDQFKAALLETPSLRLEKRFLDQSQLPALMLDDYAFLATTAEHYDNLLQLLDSKKRQKIILLGCASHQAWLIDQHQWAGAISEQGLQPSKRGYWMIGHVPVVSEIANDVLTPRGICQAFYFAKTDVLPEYFKLLNVFEPHHTAPILVLEKETKNVSEATQTTPISAENTTPVAKPKSIFDTAMDETIEVSVQEEDIETQRKRIDAEASVKIKKHIFSEAYLQSRDWASYHKVKDRKKLEAIFQKEIYFAYLKLRYPKPSATEMSFWQDVKIIQRIGDKPGQANPKTVKAKELLTLEYDSQWKVLFSMDGLITWKNGGRLMPEVVVFEKRTTKATAADAEKRRVEWRKLFQEMSRANNWYRIQYGQMELKNVMASYYGINQQVLMGEGIDDLSKGWADYFPISQKEQEKWFAEWLKKLPK
ncbi:MAG: hypothetical protein ACRCYO_06050 [Bacteroidia bacterium]